MENYLVDFMDSKYHMSVAKRMLEMYGQYSEKRVLIGVISEAAKSASKLARAFLAFDKTHGNIRTFVLRVGPKYLDVYEVDAIFKVLEIEMAHGESPVEFGKEENLIFLVNGNYKVLTVERLREFVNLVDNSLRKMESLRRQI